MSSHSLRPLFSIAAIFAGAVLAGSVSAQSLLVCQSGSTNHVQVTSLPTPNLMFPMIPAAAGPRSIRHGPDNMLYVVEPTDANPAKRVKRYYPDGNIDDTFSLPGSLTLQSPCDVAFDPAAGLLFISDEAASTIYPVYLKNGMGLGVAPLPIPALGPTYMLFKNGTLYIAEGNEIDTWKYGNPGVSQFIPPGWGGLTDAGQFAFAGNSLYVASTGTNQILEYRFNGQAFLGVFAGPGSGVLAQPIGLAIDPGLDGKLFVASSGTNTIRSYALTGSDPGTVACTGLTDLQGLCASVSERAPFPLRQNELVATYCPELMAGGPDPSQPSVIVVDQRFGGPTGENWPANFFWNERANPDDVWNYENLGSVFGITMDDGPAVSIYVTASTAYGDFGPNTFRHDSSTGQFGRGGEVYKLGGCDGAIHPWMVSGSGAVNTNELYVDLSYPLTSPGLGDICFDSLHQQFFVSNFEDGNIYRVKDIGNRGIIQSKRDPFVADTGISPFVELGERVWAVHVLKSHDFQNGVLLFSVWLRDSGRPTEPWPASWGTLPTGSLANNTIWAWPLDANGDFGASGPFLWRILPYLKDAAHSVNLGYSNPVSDITSIGSVVIIAERTFHWGDFGSINDGESAHQARVLVTGFTSSFRDTPNTWDYSYRVGDNPYVSTALGYGLGWNCAGGVAVASIRPRVWATGDAIHYPHTIPTTRDDYLYGLQGIPWLGNSSLQAPIRSKSSKLIDLDHDINGADKSQEGDVECVVRDSDTRGCGVNGGNHGGTGKAQ